MWSDRQWMRSGRLWIRSGQQWMISGWLWIRSGQQWIIHVQYLADSGWDLNDCGWDPTDGVWDQADCGWDLGDCGWDPTDCEWDLADCGRDLADWLESLTANAKVATVLEIGQQLTYQRPPWTEPDVPLFFEVLYEDAEVLVVAKPSGLPVLAGGVFLEHTLIHFSNFLSAPLNVLLLW